jgi:hypothetical protein
MLSQTDIAVFTILFFCCFIDVWLVEVIYGLLCVFIIIYLGDDYLRSKHVPVNNTNKIF